MISRHAIYRLLLYVLVVGLIGCSSVDEKTNSRDTYDWDALTTDPHRPSPEQRFQARDNTTLVYRSYGAQASIELILLHGSGFHSAYLSRLATEIASSGIARVWTPDIRGHGFRPQRRGDIDYIDQLEDDLADFSAWLRAMNPQAELVIGGHSAGGGLTIRFAGGSYRDTADGYLLLAPFLQYNAPTIRPQLSGWATPKTSRIVALNLLNALGIGSFNGITTLEFKLPPRYRTGNETLAYSYRLMTGINPRNYASDLQALEKPTLVVVGTDDESFYADEFRSVFQEFSPQAQVELMPGATHLTLVVDAGLPPLVVQWLKRSFF